MKCSAWLTFDDRRKKGSGTPYKKMHVLAPNPIRVWVEGMEICNGNLVGSVGAVEEPEWGGVSAELRVELTCDRCGNSLHEIVDPVDSVRAQRLVERAFTEYVANHELADLEEFWLHWYKEGRK